jgi:hypothetical protein
LVKNRGALPVAAPKGVLLQFSKAFFIMQRAVSEGSHRLMPVHVWAAAANKRTARTAAMRQSSQSYAELMAVGPLAYPMRSRCRWRRHTCCGCVLCWCMRTAGRQPLSNYPSRLATEQAIRLNIG